MNKQSKVDIKKKANINARKINQLPFLPPGQLTNNVL